MKRSLLTKIGLIVSSLFVLFLSSCVIYEYPTTTTNTTIINPTTTTTQSQPIIDNPVLVIPEYKGSTYTEINNNVPYFTQEQLSNNTSFETYGKLDDLKRCTMCIACIGKDLMPTEDRGAIGQVKPTGWQTVKYDFIDGKYLYNRCHLIGWQLTAENANTQNLITGTRYLNVQGMLPFENMVADYIKETGNHVLYRVTPIFEDNNLVASGVQMEAYSIEDYGDGICFNVYCFNVQPGVVIDYATGLSHEDENHASNANKETYILNTNSKKFHKLTCSSIQQISENNKETFIGSRDDLILQGYTPCGSCNP